MGTFFHVITLIGPNGQEETLDALVDTGAAFTTVPSRILECLGVDSHRTVRLRLADGKVVEWELGRITAQLNDEREEILVVFGSNDSPALIDAHTLEAFVLGVDPVQQRLVPSEAFLM